MKRKSTPDQERDAAHTKRVRIGGLDWGDAQVESVWHQILTADARTHVLRNLDVISLVAVSCASKRDCAGTRALRGEYYVDGKRMPRLGWRGGWTEAVARSRIYHEGYLREIGHGGSFNPTDVFRTLLCRPAADAAKRDECLAYAEWLGRQFPPTQCADWDDFVHHRIKEGRIDILDDLLKRFYSPSSPHSIGPRLLLSQDALPMKHQLEDYDKGQVAYALVRAYIDSLAATDEELRERVPYTLALHAQ